MSECDQTGSKAHLEMSVKPAFTSQNGRASRWIAVVTGLCVAATSLTGCDWTDDLFRKKEPVQGQYACPRPPDMIQQGGFGGQEREIRYYRHEAFGNDFFAQLELANRYAGINASDKNLEDHIESSVWLVMALTNSEGYAPMNRAIDPRGGTAASRYDKCRAFERARAYRMLNDQLSMMDSGEREKVRSRVTYILSTQGAEGFRTLGRLYDDQYGPMGEPADNPQAIRAMMRGANYGLSNARELFERSDVDAYLYNYKASETGDVGAYVLLKDFEKSAPDRARYASFVEAKAKRWTAPYEFYPPEAPAGGVPHSDESRPDDGASYALSRMDELPFIHVVRALDYLDLLHVACFEARDVPKQTIDGLRGMTGRPSGAILTNLDKVRAIQLAAVNGDSRSQLVLAVMYSEGVGVDVDYARAFYWYQQADKQGSPEARYAMSTYFDLGLQGVADQNKAESVVMQLDAALAGFKPSAGRLQEVLNQVYSDPSPVGQGR